jgi:hypothetical protein
LAISSSFSLRGFPARAGMVPVNQTIENVKATSCVSKFKLSHVTRPMHYPHDVNEFIMRTVKDHPGHDGKAANT